LTAWGDKWVGPGPAVFEHLGCGGIVEQQFCCTVCGDIPRVTAVRSRPRAPGRPSKNWGQRQTPHRATGSGRHSSRSGK
jgi:hypothetical protein